MSFFSRFGKKPSSGDNKRPSRMSGALTLRPRDTQLEQHVTKNAERELYKFSTPEQELGMTDLIKNHKAGQRFLYAALTANQDEEDSSRLRRMLNFQPKLNRQSHSLDSLPYLELVEETETFSLSDAIGKVGSQDQKSGSSSSKYKKPRKYIYIKEVMYIYGALTSTEAEFSKLQISLLDNRQLNQKVVKKIVTNSNINSNGIISMDYSFPDDALDQMSLSISRESQFLEEGSQWGVIQVKIQYQILDFPVQTSNSKVLAVNRLPQSMLEDPETNPNAIDISTMENNRRDLREMYMNGDITNEGQPIEEKRSKPAYAKSTLTGPRGSKIDIPAAAEWQFMKDRRGGAVAGDNSVEPSEEGSVRPSSPIRSSSPRPTPKSAMKMPAADEGAVSFRPRRVTVDELEDDDAPMARYRH